MPRLLHHISARYPADYVKHAYLLVLMKTRVQP